MRQERRLNKGRQEQALRKMNGNRASPTPQQGIHSWCCKPTHRLIQRRSWNGKGADKNSKLPSSGQYTAIAVMNSQPL